MPIKFYVLIKIIFLMPIWNQMMIKTEKTRLCIKHPPYRPVLSSC